MMHQNTTFLIAVMVVALAGCGSQAKPLDAKAEIAAGTEQCLRYSFDLAADNFTRARALCAPGSEEYAQATLGLAVAIHHKVPLNAKRINEQAVPLYEEAFAKGGKSLVAARAALNRGRAAEERDEKDDPVDLDTARTWYQKAIDGWTDEAIAGEATLRLAESYIQTLKPDDVRKGVALAEARAASHPSQPWAGSLWQQAGDAWWIVLHDRDNAIRCLVKAEQAGLPDPARGWITIWRVATLAEDAGQKDLAIEHYRNIVIKFPSSGKAWEAQERLRALGVEPPTIRPPLDLGTMEDKP